MNIIAAIPVTKDLEKLKEKYNKIKICPEKLK
jgi:cell division protein ZapA (FtsZ GTPase activity inhibitor)